MKSQAMWLGLGVLHAASFYQDHPGCCVPEQVSPFHCCIVFHGAGGPVCLTSHPSKPIWAASRLWPLWIHPLGMFAGSVERAWEWDRDRQPCGASGLDQAYAAFQYIIEQALCLWTQCNGLPGKAIWAQVPATFKKTKTNAVSEQTDLKKE